MRTLLLLSMALLLHANPTTLMNEPSGFYKNASGIMLPLYENITCKDEEVINQLPLDAICIIAIQRHKDGKAKIEYMGQQGWVDVSKNPDNIVLMSHDEMQIPMAQVCSQVGTYFFEIKSIQEGKPVNVYEKPSTKSKILASLPDHESCLINLGCEWPWCRVDYGDNSGWIRSINLTDKIEHVEGYCYPRERKSLIRTPQ